MVMMFAVIFPWAQPGQVACGPGHDHYDFCNASLSLDARVRDLVSRIHDEDKPNLLTARGHRNKQWSRQALPYLGVPSYYWGGNCIHSSMFANCTTDGRCSTSFPSGPSWAATFDRELMRQMAVVVGQETRAGWNLATWIDNGLNGAGLDCWGPVINMNRDPRWGRNGEGGAEDPYLMGELAHSWTTGLQRGDGSEKRYVQVAVTLKHFDANSLEGGAPEDEGFTRHNVNVNLSNYLLADYYWPAFRRAIRDAGAKGVMCSYNSVNGVPTCLSPQMKAARDAWGFDGYVTSDTDSVDDAWKRHRYVGTAGEASCLALKNGGCDIDSGNTFYDSLAAGIGAGHCSMADVDRALGHTMRVRFELGLFDSSKASPLWRLGEQSVGTAAAAALNLQAALKSLVLLRRPAGVLPLQPGRTIAVLGPHANATRSLIQVDTGKVCPFGPSGPGDAWAFDCVQTPLAAIATLNRGGKTLYAPGCSLFGNDTSGFAAALQAARAADAVVLGLGIAAADPTHSAPEYTEAEAHDRTRLSLPPAQLALAAEVAKLGKPTAIFLLNGGAVAPPDAAADAALVEAFYPGKEGARALALSLFGLANRWGKLPYTIYPASWIENNSILQHDVVRGRRTYRYGARALFPFGHGLSLSDFALRFADEPAAPLTLRTDGGADTHVLTVLAANAGATAGDEVVQAYFWPKRSPGGLAVHPVKALFDFCRLDAVPPNGTAAATFVLSRESLLLVSEVGDRVSAPGEYELTFENGAGQVLSATVELVGELTVVHPFPQ